MRRTLHPFGWIAILFVSVALAGINWKAVWLEPKNPVVLAVGETQPYTVMGLSGMNKTENLTKSPYLKIASSDPAILQVDQRNAVFVGKKPGKAE